jgi:hypothetical protein
MNLHQDLEDLTPSAYQAEIEAYLNYHRYATKEASFGKTEIDDSKTQLAKEHSCSNVDNQGN